MIFTELCLINPVFLNAVYGILKLYASNSVVLSDHILISNEHDVAHQ